uniref:Uncharacterized protein n=1 Tax=Arundo donax TaxID=35708 RepID=A0A0A9AST2_ARUDO
MFLSKGHLTEAGRNVPHQNDLRACLHLEACPAVPLHSIIRECQDDLGQTTALCIYLLIRISVSIICTVLRAGQF